MVGAGRPSVTGTGKWSRNRSHVGLLPVGGWGPGGAR